MFVPVVHSALWLALAQVDTHTDWAEWTMAITLFDWLQHRSASACINICCSALQVGTWLGIPPMNVTMQLVLFQCIHT